MKILLLPLDERPCNASFPGRLFPADKVQILLPRKLGHKKHPADFSVLSDFLFEKAKDADAMTAAFNEYSPKALRKEERPSVLDQLRKFKELVAALPGKVINREKKRELDR